MLSWKTWCAMMLGAGVGVGGTVAVERAVPKPTGHKTVKAPAKPKQKPARAAVRQPETRPPLQDCPTSLGVGAMPVFASPEIAPAPLFSEPLMPAWRDTPFVGYLPPSPGMVPEPETWAQLVVGFGLVGASLRGRKVRRSIGDGQ